MMWRVVIGLVAVCGCLSTPSRPGSDTDASLPTPEFRNHFETSCLSDTAECTLATPGVVSGELLMVVVIYTPPTARSSIAGNITDATLLHSTQWNGLPPSDQRSDLWSARSLGSPEITAHLNQSPDDSVFVYVNAFSATHVIDSGMAKGETIANQLISLPTSSDTIPRLLYGHAESQGRSNLTLYPGDGFESISDKNSNREQWRLISEPGESPVTFRANTSAPWMAFWAALR